MMRQTAISLFASLSGTVLGQFETPGTWTVEDLNLLDHRYVSAWQLKLDTKGDPSKDSILVYAFQVDSLKRLLYSTQWFLSELSHCKYDTISVTEKYAFEDLDLHRRFSVIREKYRSGMLETKYSNVRVDYTEYLNNDVAKTSVKLEYSDRTSSRSKADITINLDSWSVDSNQFSDERLTKQTRYRKSCTECENEIDSTRFFYDENESDWSISKHYVSKWRTVVSWRKFTEGKVTYRIDSLFWLDQDSIMKRKPLKEVQHRYNGDLEIERETTSWARSIVPFDGTSNIDIPPTSIKKRYYYNGDALDHVEVIKNEHGIAGKSIVDHNGNEAVNTSSKIVIERTSSGLPTAVKGEHILVIRTNSNRPETEIHFHYSDAWPSGYTKPIDLEKYAVIPRLFE